MSSSVSRKMFNADGCSRCPVGDVNLFESEPYITKQTGVWPETNPFFIDSIYHLINRNTKLSEGVLFVDFSRDNIAYFINEDWMAGLKKTRMRIVLVIDRFMKPIAQYWYVRYPDIALLPVESEGITTFLHNLERVLNGENIVLNGVTSVTENEIFVLRKQIAGESARTIAFILNCSLKNVYNYHYSLCKKLGDLPNLKKLFINHFHHYY